MNFAKLLKKTELSEKVKLLDKRGFILTGKEKEKKRFLPSSQPLFIT